MSVPDRNVPYGWPGAGPSARQNSDLIRSQGHTATGTGGTLVTPGGQAILRPDERSMTWFRLADADLMALNFGVEEDGVTPKVLPGLQLQHKRYSGQSSLEIISNTEVLAAWCTRASMKYIYDGPNNSDNNKYCTFASDNHPQQLELVYFPGIPMWASLAMKPVWGGVDDTGDSVGKRYWGNNPGAQYQTRSTTEFADNRWDDLRHHFPAFFNKANSEWESLSTPNWFVMAVWEGAGSVKKGELKPFTVQKATKNPDYDPQDEESEPYIRDKFYPKPLDPFNDPPADDTAVWAYNLTGKSIAPNQEVDIVMDVNSDFVILPKGGEGGVTFAPWATAEVGPFNCVSTFGGPAATGNDVPDIPIDKIAYFDKAEWDDSCGYKKWNLIESNGTVPVINPLKLALQHVGTNAKVMLVPVCNQGDDEIDAVMISNVEHECTQLITDLSSSNCGMDAGVYQTSVPLGAALNSQPVMSGIQKNVITDITFDGCKIGACSESICVMDNSSVPSSQWPWYGNNNCKTIVNLKTMPEECRCNCDCPTCEALEEASITGLIRSAFCENLNGTTITFTKVDADALPDDDCEPPQNEPGENPADPELVKGQGSYRGEFSCGERTFKVQFDCIPGGGAENVPFDINNAIVWDAEGVDPDCADADSFEVCNPDCSGFTLRTNDMIVNPVTSAGPLSNDDQVCYVQDTMDEESPNFDPQLECLDLAANKPWFIRVAIDGDPLDLQGCSDEPPIEEEEEPNADPAGGNGAAIMGSGSTVIDTINEQTISLYAKVRNTDLTSDTALVSFINQGNPNTRFAFGIDSVTNAPALFIRDPEQKVLLAPAGSLDTSDGEWHEIVYSVDFDYATVYIDGFQHDTVFLEEAGEPADFIDWSGTVPGKEKPNDGAILSDAVDHTLKTMTGQIGSLRLYGKPLNPLLVNTYIPLMNFDFTLNESGDMEDLAGRVPDITPPAGWTFNEN